MIIVLVTVADEASPAGFCMHNNIVIIPTYLLTFLILYNTDARSARLRKSLTTNVPLKRILGYLT